MEKIPVCVEIKKQPSFGLPNSKPEYCSTHKLNGIN